MTKSELIKDGWVCTDSDTNQWRKGDEDGDIFTFREDRVIDPQTGKIEVFQTTIDLNDYDWWEQTDACTSFGYSLKQIDDWINSGEEGALRAECIFEMTEI